MPSGRRHPEPTVRVLDWSTADSLDLEATVAHLGIAARARLEASSPADARRFLIGRALLTRTIADTLHVDDADIRISARCPDCDLEHGRPSATIGDLIVHASISHTTRATAVAVSPALPVGVDLERLDPARFAGVEVVALSPAELRHWERLTPTARLRSLADTWTTKEAFLKALGTGLTVDPRAIEIPRRPASGRPTPILGHDVLLSHDASTDDLVVAVARLLA